MTTQTQQPQSKELSPEPEGRGDDTSPVTGLGLPRQRRRPLVLVACVALVCAGALLAVWAHSASTSTVKVLAARGTITQGEKIDQSDLKTVQVSVDSGVSTVAAEQAPRLDGRRAALDIPAGSLLTEAAVKDTVVPAAGFSIVGVTLPPGQLPGEPLQVGDQVRVVDAPGAAGAAASGESSEGAADGPVPVAVEVAGVKGAGEGQTTVSVIVPEDQAADLASRAATGKVVIVLDSRER